MIILFKLAFLTIITVLAWRIAVSEDMVFERVGKFAENKVEKGHRYFDLLICPWCMGTVWSLPSWALAYITGIVNFNDWHLVFFYPLCVFMSSIVCGLTWTAYLAINSVKEKNDIEAKYLENIEQLTFFDLKYRKQEYYNNKVINGK